MTLLVMGLEANSGLDYFPEVNELLAFVGD